MINKSFILAFIFLLSFKGHDKPLADIKEARAAFNYLNSIRKAPQNFKNIFHDFDNIKAMPGLKWNDTLARVAEARAMDMATNNYLKHVDANGYAVNYYIQKAGYSLKPEWTKRPDANYFESCNGGGTSGQDAIISLIQDQGIPDLSHRKHLLGIDSWSSTLVDIGIGFVRSNNDSYFKTYTSIIIAKHK